MDSTLPRDKRLVDRRFSPSSIIWGLCIIGFQRTARWPDGEDSWTNKTLSVSCLHNVIHDSPINKPRHSFSSVSLASAAKELQYSASLHAFSSGCRFGKRENNENDPRERVFSYMSELCEKLLCSPPLFLSSGLPAGSSLQATTTTIHRIPPAHEARDCIFPLSRSLPAMFPHHNAENIKLFSSTAFA